MKELAQARNQVAQMLQRADSAILDAVTAAIGPREAWDLSTPGRAQHIIKTYSMLVG